MILAIEHAGAVLGLFTSERPEWGASAVARALGISKSAAHNMLVSLTAIGLLRRVDRGHYRLGWRALEMADVIAGSDEVVTAAAPVMRHLVRAWGTPVALAAGPGALVVALTDERGTRVGTCSWFSHAAIRKALSSDDPVPQPFVVHEGGRCHVAMEIEHGRPGLRLAVGSSLPAVRADRAVWIVPAAAELGCRLRQAPQAHEDLTAELAPTPL
jgi:hypothetical protein